MTGSTEPDTDTRAAPGLALACLLLGIAGWVDAVGFLQLGNVFVSFMSGNTTQLAVNLSGAAWSQAGSIAAVIGLFVAGVFLGTLVAERAGRWQLPAILATEALLLVVALLLPPTPGGLPAPVIPVVLAMGWQNAALQRVGEKKISLTYVTGTLVAFGRGLAQAVSGSGERWSWSADLLLWLAMATGTVAGAAVFATMGFRALAIPAAALLVLAVANAAARSWGRTQDQIEKQG